MSIRSPGETTWTTTSEQAGGHQPPGSWALAGTNRQGDVVTDISFILGNQTNKNVGAPFGQPSWVFSDD